MNPLTDDPVDADLRAVLQGIEGRSPLSVDVDTVIARGRSRRTAVLAERVLAVAVVLAVVVGATVFAARSSSDHGMVVGPVQPTGTSSLSGSPLSLVVDLNGGGNRPAGPRTTSQVFLLHNGTRARLTITGWRVIDPTGAVKGALAEPIRNGAYEGLTLAQQRALLNGPVRATVTLEPNEEVNLVVQLRATCTASDKAIKPALQFDLRADDGTTGQTVIAPDAFANLPGAPRKYAGGWVSDALMGACTPDLSTEPGLLLESAHGEKVASLPRTGRVELRLRNELKRRITITGWHVDDPTGSTIAALDGPVPWGGHDKEFPSAEEDALLAAKPVQTATLTSQGMIYLILQVSASCTDSDKAIQPTIVLDVRWDDGTTGQTVIDPLDGFASIPGRPWDGWAATAVGYACSAG